MSERVEVKGHPGVYVRRLSFRAFAQVQAHAQTGEAAGDARDLAFSCALALASAVDGDGAPLWADYEAVANDERPMLVADVIGAATDVNGLSDEADEGNG